MFRVRWERRALEELARMWIDATSELRAAITAASDAVDRRLRTNPFREGESRGARRRIFFPTPLAVLFRIEPDEVTVSVLHVWLMHKSPK